MVGDNGQGKTNLLEAVYYVNLLRSVRGARDGDVARFDSSGFFLEASMRVPDGHTLSVGFERIGRRKRVRRDDVVIERFSDALGTLPAVMFAPVDVELVSGAPRARRRYLDIMLALSSRGYLHALQNYRAALERRNAALRASGRSGSRPSAIEVWEGPLADHGAMLVRARRAWVKEVAERFQEYGAAIGERIPMALHYETSVDANAESVELAIAEAMAARRDADLRLGVTQVGPHRDDIRLALGGRDVRVFGSAGQQRSAAIVLRTLEVETLRAARGVAPVFLLDDPFAELDTRRASRVLRLLKDVGFGQTILAVPRDADIPPELTMLERRRLEQGRFIPV